MIELLIGFLFLCGVALGLYADHITEKVAQTVVTSGGVGYLRSNWMTRYVINHAHARVVHIGARYLVQIAGPTGWKRGCLCDNRESALWVGKNVAKRLGEIREQLSTGCQVIWAERNPNGEYPGP
jgi:hypothetical protein